MTTPCFSRTSEKDFSLIHLEHELLVVNKPSGLLSVPGRGEDKQDCLIKRLQTQYPDALIVHRLDCDTSGLLVMARGKEMHRRLSILFQNRQVEKRYIAVVDGKLALPKLEIYRIAVIPAIPLSQQQISL